MANHTTGTPHGTDTRPGRGWPPSPRTAARRHIG